MLVLLSAAIVVVAVVWAARASVGALLAVSRDARKTRALTLMQLFAPAVAAVQTDPRALLTWQPFATAARVLLPDEFADLDRAFDGGFPFSANQIEAAHAQWTADWLAWERTHDAQYKLKAAEAEHHLAGESVTVARAKLEAIEREKLELYQRRYEEYVRVSKALRALTPS